MQKLVLTTIASAFFALGVVNQSALAMGGMGGPSDAWGSPYVLIAPQTFQPPPGWGPLEGRSAYEGRPAAPIDCHGDRTCEREMKKRVHAPAQ